TDKYIEDAQKVTNLRYEYGDYSKRDYEIDKMFFEDMDGMFKMDTGLSLKLVLSVMEFLSSHNIISVLAASNKADIYNNVVEVPITALAEEFISFDTYSLEDFYGTLQFISIEPNKLVDKNGVIPMWGKKKRQYKF